VTDDPDDHVDPAPDVRRGKADDPGRRRSVWERRIAIAVLATFGAFVLYNLVAVLAMLYSGAMRGGGSPFGP
jgi:hypothetical protein